MNATCPCGEPLPDTASIGPRCRDRLERELGDIPALVADLDLTLSRQTGGQRYGTIGRAADKPLPYDLGASDALGGLRVVLVGWVRVLDLGDVMPADDLPSMARWLQARIVRIVGHVAGAEIASEVHEAVRQSVRVGAVPQERLWAGPCGTGTCSVDIYATPGSTTAVCRSCGAEHDVPARRQWMRDALEEVLLTSGQIAGLSPHLLEETVSRDRLKKWVRRELIFAQAVNAMGHPTYRVGDVRALVEASVARKGQAA